MHTQVPTERSVSVGVRVCVHVFMCVHPCVCGGRVCLRARVCGGGGLCARGAGLRRESGSWTCDAARDRVQSRSAVVGSRGSLPFLQSNP